MVLLKFIAVILMGGLFGAPPLFAQIQYQVGVNQSSGPFYFSQVAVGPLGTSEFRTVLLLVNRNEEPANDVQVRFFGQDGNPMDVIIDGAPWDNQPFAIPALGSRRLVFTGQDLKSGWAEVNASINIAGLLLYQVVAQNSVVETEVGLFATEAATRFATFFKITDEIAIAVANPTPQPATVTVRLMDDTTGNPVFSKNLFADELGGVLPGMNHQAKFLAGDFKGALPQGFSVGTLLIESDVPVSITLLKTRGGVVFSTLPVASTR